MFDAVLERALKDRVRRRRVRLAAIDGTGMESRHVSRYFTKRQADGNPDGDRTYAHYPKVVFVADCASHMILAAVPGRGPATDLVQFGRAFSQAVRRARIEVLLADADFDAEWLHVAVRSHGVRTIIPPTRGRPSDKPPAGRWRRVMKQRFARLRRRYGQRWQVETVNSMIKRRLGSALRARVEENQFREIILRAITHNVMIVRLQVFYRAVSPTYRRGSHRCRQMAQAMTLPIATKTTGRNHLSNTLWKVKGTFLTGATVLTGLGLTGTTRLSAELPLEMSGRVDRQPHHTTAIVPVSRN